jgi:hypothetical protein
VYPEFAESAYNGSSWDMLLVLEQARPPSEQEARWGLHERESPLGPGTQIGVEAKLRCNCAVLEQALPPDFWDVEEQIGPDYRAVLVPHATAHFASLAGRPGIVVLEAEPKTNSYLGPVAGRLERELRRCAAWPHEARHKLPEVIVDGPAGVPSPIQMTRWRIQAIRLCIRLRDRGWVTRQDFRELGIGPTTWYHRWLVKGEKVGRQQRWVATDGFEPFDERHPDAARQLREKDEEAEG